MDEGLAAEEEVWRTKPMAMHIFGTNLRLRDLSKFSLEPAMGLIVKGWGSVGTEALRKNEYSPNGCRHLHGLWLALHNVNGKEKR